MLSSYTGRITFLERCNIDRYREWERVYQILEIKGEMFVVQFLWYNEMSLSNEAISMNGDIEKHRETANNGRAFATHPNQSPKMCSSETWRQV